MKHKSGFIRIASLLLAFIMIFSLIPLSTYAAVGDLSNVSNGLQGGIDTSNTSSLPIQILDYEADGMLFEYAESKQVKKASDFGASFYTSFTEFSSVSSIQSSDYGNYWLCTTDTLNTSNSDAAFLRATYAKNSTQVPHTCYGSRSGVILPNDLGGIAMDDIRYLVLVYRSNVTSGSIGFFVERQNADRNNTNNRTKNYTFSSEGTKNWTYAVYDLYYGNLKNSWNNYGGATAVWTTLPMDSSGEYIDIAHVALFGDKDQAEKFGEYALTDGSDRGDNRAFGLLRSSRTEANGTNYEGIIDKTDTVEQFNTYNDITNIDYSSISTLGYTLLGIFNEKGIANIGLLESSLSAEGNPVYKEEVVTYLAGLLKHSLEIPERTSDGWKNYRYVKGTASDIYGGTDLATALRNKINGNTGSYADSAKKDLVGTWTEVSGNISSYFDAAYFLLNSIFVDGSYNEPQDDYNYLVLSGATNEDGNDVYVFDAGYTTSSTPSSAKMAIDYNTENKTIQNTSAAGKTHFVYEGSSTTTLNPFLPVTDKNNADDQTNSVYYQDDGVISKGTTMDTYVNRNFNFALYSKSEFVYHADDELFFEFEGDDDVYLFINGELVMDIGSAHSIDNVTFNLNDYVSWAKENLNSGDKAVKARAEKLALEEGNTYSFSFYYMERHGYGSNMRIVSNFRFTDPTMTTEKTAYQDGTQLDYDSIVDKDGVIEYGFGITNSGTENLYNLTYDDSDIGVSITYSSGLMVNGDRVYDINGGKLEASDLTAILTISESEQYEITFDSNDALKDFLANPTHFVSTNSVGLPQNASVLIRGVGYKLSESQVNDGIFDNTVFTSTTNLTKTETLYGQASMRVFVPSDPMYYQWADHELHITKSRLIADVLAAASQDDNLLYGKVPSLKDNNVNKMEFTTAKGYSMEYSDVSLDNSFNLTIDYPEAGAYLFYIKITYDTSKTVVVPVPVYVTDVQDSVFVLDYGLGVELTEDDELYKNDRLTVPGRETKTKIWGISDQTPSYEPNNIKFTASDSNIIDGNYGNYIVDNNTIKYVPDEFIEGTDSVYIAVGVYEENKSNNELGNVNINKEVQMYKSVTVLPANVVYYEDNFPAITYNENTENVFTPVTPDVAPLQSADQSEQYGHDSTYENTDVDEISAGALTTITINEFSNVASFTFKGTGFELIGRTNAKDSATIVVTVKDSTGNRIKTIPVITEYDNYNNEGDEEIYQVPVIRVTDLSTSAQEYTVEISGVPARDYSKTDENGVPVIIPTYLYIDGLRIYQPVEGVESEDGTVLEELYLETEQDADFVELRNQIIQGKIATVEYNMTDGITVSTSTSTWTENLSGEYLGDQLHFNEVSDVSDYLIQGPNNEVYMTGTYDNAALVFYVKETDSSVHSLQIALRGLDESLFFAGIEATASPNVNAIVRVGIYDNSEYKWDDLANCTSSTEQYYVIDYKQCYYDEEKDAYQVVIRVDDGMASYTNLKLTGLELVSVDGNKTDLKYVNGILMQNSETVNEPESDIATASWVEADASTFVAFRSVSYQMASTMLLSDTEDTEVSDPETDIDSSEPDTDSSENTSALEKFLNMLVEWITKIVNMIKQFFEN